MMRSDQLKMHGIPREVERRFRGIIREELLRGVPDFALRRATDEYIESLQRAILPHVRATAKSSAETREAQARLRAALEELGDEVQALLQDRLYQYVRRV
jgi:hypothetical protein